jgi:molybdopterin converting factor small subunit
VAEDDGVRPGLRAGAERRAEHATVYHRLLTEQGELRPHVNVFVGTESIRHTGGLDTPLSPDSEVIVLPSVSGG